MERSVARFRAESPPDETLLKPGIDPWFERTHWRRGWLAVSVSESAGIPHEVNVADCVSLEASAGRLDRSLALDGS